MSEPNSRFTVFFFSQYSVIKLGSPNLNFLIIGGATLLYLSLFFYATSAYHFSQVLEETILCNVSITAWEKPETWLFLYHKFSHKFWYLIKQVLQRHIKTNWYCSNSVHILTTRCIMSQFRFWLFSVGNTLCFAVILAKQWRIYHIFSNPIPNKKVTSQILS